MNELMNTNVLTMSSEEMAILTETRHDNVKRTIATLVEQKVIQLPQIEELGYINNLGFSATKVVCHVSKRDSFVVVAQLSPMFTGRVMDRWMELESQQPTLPTTYIAALEALVNAEKEKTEAITLANSLIPKVEAFDRLSNSEGAHTITDTAKMLSIQPKKLTHYMLMTEWMFRRAGSKEYTAYQNRITQGLLENRPYEVRKADGTSFVVMQVLVLPKGLTKLASDLNGIIEKTGEVTTPSQIAKHTKQ